MKQRLSNLMDRFGLDKRKAILAGLLLLAMMVLWGRLIFSGQPRHALADLAQTAAPTSTPTKPVVHVDLTEELHGDPFAVTLAPPPATAIIHSPTPSANSSPQPIAESPRAVLILQSTILGQRPRALINGQIVAPGQTIMGHRLIEVRPREVVLERAGVQILLGM